MTNKDFFKVIDSEIKAYLLGFIVADGSVSIRNRTKGNSNYTEYSLNIIVHKKDIYIFDLFKEFVKPDINYGTREDKYIRFSMHGKDFVENIVQFGYLPNKTYSEMKLPDIDKDLIRHFIRGYFDGDGTCTANITKENRADYKFGYYYRVKSVFHIYSKMKNILYEIQSFMTSHNINLQIYYVKNSNGYVIKNSKRETFFKLYDFLYKDANYYFRRKKETFEYTMMTPSKFKELKNFDLCRA